MKKVGRQTARLAGMLAIVHAVITLILNFSDLSDWMTIYKFLGVATASTAIILLASIAAKSESWVYPILIIVCSIIGMQLGDLPTRWFLFVSLVGGILLTPDRSGQTSDEAKKIPTGKHKVQARFW